MIVHAGQQNAQECRRKGFGVDHEAKALTKIGGSNTGLQVQPGKAVPIGVNRVRFFMRFQWVFGDPIRGQLDKRPGIFFVPGGDKGNGQGFCPIEAIDRRHPFDVPGRVPFPVHLRAVVRRLIRSPLQDVVGDIVGHLDFFLQLGLSPP